jgi:type IV pilus assembly protein PilA
MDTEFRQMRGAANARKTYAFQRLTVEQDPWHTPCTLLRHWRISAVVFVFRHSQEQKMLKQVQKGFTLIELMIVVAIIGILAAIAIPAYQDYTVRSQVTEGLNLASSIKAEVAEYYAQYGSWPTAIIGGAGTLGHLAGQEPSGKYVKNVTILNPGTIQITYSAVAPFVANQKLDTKVLLLRPRLSGVSSSNGNEDVVWLCGRNAGSGDVHDPAVASVDNVANTTVDNKYMPANCRP